MAKHSRVYSSTGGETLELLAIGAGIEDKVIRPDMVVSHGRQWPRTDTSDAPTRPAARDLQPSLSPEAMAPIRTHDVPLSPQKDPDSSIPIAWILRSQVLHRSDRWGILSRQNRLIAQGGSSYAQERARASLGNPAAHRVPHGPSTLGHA
jgi:hypothetical protein